MPKGHPTVFCGFADIQAHLECKNLDHIRDYNIRMGQIHGMRVNDEVDWGKHRKRREAHLKTR